jgi:trimeric autotransporter adhesin
MTSYARPRLAVQPLEDRATPAMLVGLTTDNRLWTFDSGDPTKIIASVKVSGLQPREDLVALDARPATGQLYAPSNQGRLYVLNPVTGVATAVSTTPASILPKGSPFGFDFNPTVDRVRLVAAGKGELNVRYNPNDGTAVDGDPVAPDVQPDTALAFAAGDANQGRNPTVVAAAYTNNFFGATQTTLFGLDAGRNVLVTIGGPNGTPSPNGGQLATVGNLGTNIGTAAAFDIAADGTAYAAVRTGNGMNPTRLATVNLTTGQLTLGSQIGPGRSLDGMAVLPRDEIAYAVTAANRLISFRGDDPGTLLSSFAISGLTAGESIIGLDVRPATGELLALTDQNRVLRIEPGTGQGVQVGAAIDGSLLGAGVPGGFDFNPAADRLRLVNGANDNLRFNPVTFTPVDGDIVAPGVQGDTDLIFGAADPNFGADPNVVAAAYDRNDNDGATPTTLFGIDSELDILVRQGGVDGTPSPNLGALTTIGTLGLDPTDNVAFDIAGVGSGAVGVALAVMELEGNLGTSLLCTVNLATGSIAVVGAVGGGDVIRGFAIAPPRVGFSAANVSVGEKTANANIVLTRTGGSYGTATLRFSSFAGTAVAGQDFTNVTDFEVTFAPGETRKVIQVPVLQDTTREPNETVFLALSALTADTTNVLLSNPTAVLTIVDDDGGASTGI